MSSAAIDSIIYFSMASCSVLDESSCREGGTGEQVYGAIVWSVRRQ